MKFLHTLLSDEQDQWDLGILQWFVGTVVFLGLSLYSYGWKGQVWDPMSFGAGLLGVLGAGAALQWIRTKGPTQSSQVTTVVQSTTEVPIK